MVVIRKTWMQPRITRRKCGKGETAAPATFGPGISPVTAITAGPVVVSSGAEHTHIQGSAQSTWTVAHNLGKRPDVEITSVGGLAIAKPEILHLNANTLTITFDEPFAGQAYCH